MTRSLLFLGLAAQLARTPAAAPYRPLFVAPVRPRVFFGPTSPPRFQFLRVDRRGFPGQPPLLLAQPPRLRVSFRGVALGPKLLSGAPLPSRGRLLVIRPPRAVGPFGPHPTTAPLFFRLDQRGSRGRFGLVQPPRKPYFFQAGALMAPRFMRVDQRGAPGRLLLQAVPRQVVTFAPPVTRPLRFIQQDRRGASGSLVITRLRRLPPAPPAPTPIAVVLTERGYQARIIG